MIAELRIKDATVEFVYDDHLVIYREIKTDNPKSVIPTLILVHYIDGQNKYLDIVEMKIYNSLQELLKKYEKE